MIIKVNIFCNLKPNLRIKNKLLYKVGFLNCLIIKINCKNFGQKDENMTRKKIIPSSFNPLITHDDLYDEINLETRKIEFKLNNEKYFSEILNKEDLELSSIQKIFKNTLGKYLEIKEDYFYTYKHEFNDEEIPGILDRSRAYKTTDKFIMYKIENSVKSRFRSPLNCVSSLSGGGKTVFLKTYPLFFMNGQRKDNILPIYITFNENSSFDDLETSSRGSLNCRILYNFFENLEKKLTNFELQDFSSFRAKNFKKYKKYETFLLLKMLSDFTGREILLLVDEIVQIRDSSYRDEIITICGKLQDQSRFIHIVVSTLYYEIIEKPLSKISHRQINYIYLEPLRSFSKLMIEHPNYKKLKHLTNFQLVLNEISVLPRHINILVNKIITKFDTKEKINELNKKTVRELMEYNLIYGEIIKKLDAIMLIDHWGSIVKHALNFALKNSTYDYYAEKIYENFSVGNCYKYGIFMNTTSDGKPVASLLLFKKLIESMKLEKNHPAQLFLNAATVEHPNKDLQNYGEYRDIISNKFEILNSSLDMLLRVFYFYDENLFPEKWKEAQVGTYKSTTYSNIFKGALVSLNDPETESISENELISGNGHFINDTIMLKPYYFLEHKFYDLSSNEKKSQSCFDYFRDEDWKIFLKGDTVFMNSRGGKGFDSVIFDEVKSSCKYITFFQDKYDFYEKGLSPDEIGKLEKTYSKCKEVFDYVVKNHIYDVNINKYLNFRLVYRSFKIPLDDIGTTFEEEFSIKLKNKNIIYLGFNQLMGRTESFFGQRYYFMRYKVNEKTSLN